MRCTNPYYLKKQGILVPCGRCKSCRINRAQEWSRRMTHEAHNHENNAFITLTYNDDQLPQGGSIDKAELQKFIKRLRKRMHSPIKYYATGEYGSQTQRPHYHLIIFGFETCQNCRVCTKIDRLRGKLPDEGTNCHDLEQAWDKGIVQAGTVTPASTRYVADYLQKAFNHDKEDPREKPFAIMSQAIGHTWQKDNYDLVTCYLGLQEGTKRSPVPRYYQQKIIESYGEFAPQIQFLIRMNKLRHTLRTNQKLRDFWEKRNTGLIHGLIKADIQTNIDLSTREALRSSRL